MALMREKFLDKFPEVPGDLNLDDFDLSRIPVHIAIIMDGNGRWAQSQGFPRGAGHIAGVEGVREAIKACNDLGVRYLTIYSFSTENWNRPQQEVDLLMNLFATTMADELPGLEEEHARVKLIGRIDALPEETRKVFEDSIERTKDNDGLTLTMAVNYGGRDEIASAISRLLDEYRQGTLSPDLLVDGVTEDMISERLFTAGIPDPDLLIRTSGEFRLSNFLLWQCAYSELYITDTLWPDFDRYELLRSIIEYQRRDRRFGGVK